MRIAKDHYLLSLYSFTSQHQLTPTITLKSLLGTRFLGLLAASSVTSSKHCIDLQILERNEQLSGSAPPQNTCVILINPTSLNELQLHFPPFVPQNLTLLLLFLEGVYRAGEKSQSVKVLASKPDILSSILHGRRREVSPESHPSHLALCTVLQEHTCPHHQIKSTFTSLRRDLFSLHSHGESS